MAEINLLIGKRIKFNSGTKPSPKLIVVQVLDKLIIKEAICYLCVGAQNKAYIVEATAILKVY